MADALSITTDFISSTGSPEASLRLIAGAGFTHVHWCHQWNTDFHYSLPEIQAIGHWLEEGGLALLDLHASAGVEKSWVSPLDYARLAGVELIKNRIAMTRALGGDVIILHTGNAPAGEEASFWTALRRSLDALQPYARERGVRIAIENGNWTTILTLLGEYAPDFLGICYDSGHGNLGHGGLEELAAVRDRLISVHLHDNDGKGDLHKLPFTGTIPWPRLAEILADSSYAKCVSMESVMRNTGIADGKEFLSRAHEAGLHLTRMIETVSPPPPKP